MIAFLIEKGCYTIEQLKNIIASAERDADENTDLRPTFIVFEEDGDAIYQQYGNNLCSRFSR